jgi:outer membrane lipoprotein LolB
MRGRCPACGPGPIRVLLPWLLLLMLPWSCAIVPEPAREPARYAFEARAERVEALERWRLAGRILLEAPGESWSGQLGWRGQPGIEVVDLSGPMGRGGGRLSVDAAGALLVTREGDRYVAADADELMYRLAGSAVPVQGLRYWVRGMARPGAGYDLRSDVLGLPLLLI